MFENITDNAKRREVSQKFNEAMTAYKMTTIFPNDGLPQGFLDLVRKCLSFHTPTSLQMKTETFRAIKTNYDLNFTLIDIGSVLYAMQNRTQADMGMNDKDYDNFIVLTDTLVHQMIDIAQIEADRLSAEMEAAALVELEKVNEFNEAVAKGNEALDGEKPETKTINLGITADSVVVAEVLDSK